MATLMTAVNKINDKLDEQAQELKLLKANMITSLTSTTAISAQLNRRSADLLQHDERLKAHIKSSGNADQLLKSKGIAPSLKFCC